MKRKYYYFVFLLLSLGFSLKATAGEVRDYLEKYKQTTVSDYTQEKKLLLAYTSETLIAELELFYTDTVAAVRQKAYYFTYKKGLQSPSAGRSMAVERLIKGIDGTGGGLTGQLIGYLQEFVPTDFNAAAQAAIEAKLRNPKIPYYADLVLLAGYVGVGRAVLYQQYLTPELPVKGRWNLALALARMGETKETEYCVKKIKSLPVNNNMVNYALSDLIYTRQKQAIAYCVELLYSDEKQCSSPDPDSSERFPCAYRIMEKLAPVIVGFPVKQDVTGQLDVADYSKTLQLVRTWFKDHPKYEIKNDTY